MNGKKQNRILCWNIFPKDVLKELDLWFDDVWNCQGFEKFPGSDFRDHFNSRQVEILWGENSWDFDSKKPQKDNKK